MNLAPALSELMLADLGEVRVFGQAAGIHGQPQAPGAVRAGRAVEKPLEVGPVFVLGGLNRIRVLNDDDPPMTMTHPRR